MVEALQQGLPKFLKSQVLFTQHLDEHFEPLDKQQRGAAFLEFALRLLPCSEWWSGLKPPEKSPRQTHDEGVDFDAASEKGDRVVHGQSKYKVRKADELDTIISKFNHHETLYLSPGTNLALALGEPAKPLPQYVIVTSSDLTNITESYESKQYSSRDFYDRLRREKRLFVAHGPLLLAVLQEIYSRTFVQPLTLDVELDSDVINVGRTYIAVISADTVRKLYEESGSSLFFENIRDFLGISEPGPDREDVNAEILATLTKCPERMLERNNGITFKTDELDVIGPRQLRLHNCSIVNGCQTTMCVVKAGQSPAARLLVKIVNSDDSWEVAKAANHQNPVTRIDLELARFLRPQLVSKAAAESGYGAPMNIEDSVANVLAAIHKRRISYDEAKLLTVAVFSRSPNNLWQSNYTELRIDVLQAIAEAGESPFVLQTIFSLLSAMKEATEECRRIHQRQQDLFKRFFADDHPKYRCYLAILAAAGCTSTLLGFPPSDTRVAKDGLIKFLRELDSVIANRRPLFSRVFTLAFSVAATRLYSLGGDEQDIQVKMFREMSTPAFKSQYNMLAVRIDEDTEVARLRGLEIQK